MLQAEKFREILSVMKFTHAAATNFWRAVYKGGMWLRRGAASDIVAFGWRILVAQLGQIKSMYSLSFCILLLILKSPHHIMFCIDRIMSGRLCYTVKLDVQNGVQTL